MESTTKHILEVVLNLDKGSRLHLALEHEAIRSPYDLCGLNFLDFSKLYYPVHHDYFEMLPTQVLKSRPPPSPNLSWMPAKKTLSNLQALQALPLHMKLPDPVPDDHMMERPDPAPNIFECYTSQVPHDGNSLTSHPFRLLCPALDPRMPVYGENLSVQVPCCVDCIGHSFLNPWGENKTYTAHIGWENGEHITIYIVWILGENLQHQVKLGSDRILVRILYVNLDENPSYKVQYQCNLSRRALMTRWYSRPTEPPSWRTPAILSNCTCRILSLLLVNFTQ